ncbi:MaoC/PaaZ C-terminal domain-containing protein [Streptomyces sp. NPDC002896]|uniref:MaoC/PaaZ C-terminal domain-containing protein n=1 Tax=Streptomyces sp. NPDC002896 TaxID=3154438 RepID=UPI003327D4BA
MPIDATVALDAPPLVREVSWTDRDVLLYHLGIGAGASATDPKELRYTYERDLQVLPSFATVVGGGVVGEGGLNALPGLKLDLKAVLHGGQEVVVHRPIPAQGTAIASSGVSAVYDKGKAAVIVIESTAALPDGTPLYASRNEIFVRGEGGFGGDRGPTTAFPPPDRAPEFVVERPTHPNQALLYRLSGDRNPLHAEPAFAAAAGFDRPILHGLCSYGLVLKAAVDTCLGGETTRVARYRGQFAGVFFPGETMRVRIWQGPGTRLLVRATAADRDDAPVLSNCTVEYHD